MSTDAGECQPLNKAVVLHSASTESVANSKAVTVLTYLHGVKESQVALEKILSENLGADMDLIELRTLKPMDMDTIRASLQRTHKVIILGVDFPRVLHLFFSYAHNRIVQFEFICFLILFPLFRACILLKHMKSDIIWAYLEVPILSVNSDNIIS